MHIVLVGLSPARVQHLATALRQVLATINLHFNFQTPELSAEWIAPAALFRIVLCAGQEVGNTSAAWRQRLLALNLPFQVIHAENQGYVGPCLMALLPPESVNGLSRQATPLRWQGVCDTCSDPDCELRLFSGLLQGR